MFKFDSIISLYNHYIIVICIMEELRKKNKELKALYKETLRELNALENRLENNLENNLETTNVRSVQELWFDCRESSISGAGWGVFVKRSFKEGDVIANIEISHDGPQ